MQDGVSTAPASILADLTSAVPHSVTGTHAGCVWRRMLRPSTAAVPWRQRDRPGAGAAVPLLWLPAAGADLPALRPGEQLLRPAVRARGASAQGAGLLLLDKDVEPALWLLSNESGTSLTLAEKGKAKKVFKP